MPAPQLACAPLAFFFVTGLVFAVVVVLVVVVAVVAVSVGVVPAAAATLLGCVTVAVVVVLVVVAVGAGSATGIAAAVGVVALAALGSGADAATDEGSCAGAADPQATTVVERAAARRPAMRGIERSAIGSMYAGGSDLSTRVTRATKDAFIAHAPTSYHLRAMSLTERTRELWSRAREEALYAKGHVLGMEHRAPPADAPLRRFVYGAALPFHVMRAVLAVPDARRAYARVMFWQLLAMIPVGIVVCWMSIDSDDKHGFAHWLALASAIFSALSIAEWIIVALAREYHDHLSFAAAALTGAPHTLPTAAPRVHLDVGWLWLKGKRKLRSLLLIAVAVPFCFLLSLVPRAGDWLYGIALGLWTFYWLSVFALANSDLAWHAPLVPREPFFLRASTQASRVPVVGAPFLLYNPIARRVTRSVHHACQSFEEAPWEGAGLAFIRTVFGIPGLYLLTRPLMPVAATHALLSRRLPGHSVPPPVAPPALPDARPS